jgi:hypothetical protein
MQFIQTQGIRIFSRAVFVRIYQDNGESCSGQAQAWMFDLFDFAWGCAVRTEHGADVETQRRFVCVKCSAPCADLYLAGSTPSVTRWATYFLRLFAGNDGSLTEEFLPKAKKRVKAQQRRRAGQRSLTAYYELGSTPQFLGVRWS